MLELTSSEVSSLPADTKVYEGVGKMYVWSRDFEPAPHLSIPPSPRSRVEWIGIDNIGGN
jgi:hypothetical protein